LHLDVSVETSTILKNSEIDSCPIGHRTIHDGYHLCTGTCGSVNYAEVEAIQKANDAGVELDGAILFFIGNTKSYLPNFPAMKEAGLSAYWMDGQEVKINKA
jgi:hypothetical protein